MQVQPSQPLNIQGNFSQQQEQIPVDLHESKAISMISHQSTTQNLIKHFQAYHPKNNLFDIHKLHQSSYLKLKKYKESVYYGEFNHNKRNGEGIMMYNNGRLYQGGWRDDFKEGYAYEKFTNQCLYEGEYKEGKPNGVGKYRWITGEFYEGQWKNGMKNGSGMWRSGKGDTYIGEWKQGKADGYGVYTWINGDRYEGEFKNNLKHFEGFQKFGNGDIYKGHYVEGKPSGFGEYYWQNGSYFKGQFKQGLRYGQGLWKRGPANSDRYQGEYINDKKQGYGIFTWKSGNVYKGNYLMDFRHGYGEMFWSDGSYYKGQWKNGIQDGEGELYVPGQGIKRGMFSENVLVVVESQSGFEDPSVDDPEKQFNLKKSFVKSIKQGKNPSKPSQKSRSVKPVHINQINVVRYSNTNQNSFSQRPLLHPLLQKKFQQRRNYIVHKKNQGGFERSSFKANPISQFSNSQTRNINKFDKSKQIQKDRILHSSFYLHKMHNNRATTSITVSRANAQSEMSGYSESIQYGSKQNTTKQQRGNSTIPANIVNEFKIQNNKRMLRGHRVALQEQE